MKKQIADLEGKKHACELWNLHQVDP